MPALLWHRAQQVRRTVPALPGNRRDLGRRPLDAKGGLARDLSRIGVIGLIFVALIVAA
jgi:hypothetical protein